MNVLPCVLVGQDSSLIVRFAGLEGGHAIDFSNAGASVTPLLDGTRIRDRALLGLRAEHVVVHHRADTRQASSSCLIDVPAEVHRLEPMGHETLARLMVGTHAIVARLADQPNLRPGDHVTLGLDLGHAVWFDPDSGAALRREGVKSGPVEP
jgi:ABC-type sugar transport system ATPase subunit